MLATDLALSTISCREGQFFVQGGSGTANALGMCIFYAIQAFLSFVIYCGMCCFARYLPTETGSLNTCFKCFGGLVRFFMRIQVILHYVTMI